MVTSDETQEQAKKPDAKDFVQHLRTVHFTLLTVCLALIVIIKYPSPFAIREAIRQLNTIEDATHVWKDTWIDEGVPKELKSVPDFSSCIKPVTSDFSIESYGKRINVHFANINWTMRTSAQMAINSSYNTDANYVTVRHTTIDAPKGLDDFKRIWNNSYSIICPTKIAEEGMTLLFSADHAIAPIKKEKVFSGMQPTLAMLMDNGVAAKFTGLHKAQGAESEGLYYNMGLANMAMNPNAPLITMEKTPMMFEIPVLESRVIPFDYRALLIKELPQYNWLHADFKDAFYELDQAIGSRQNLDFENIKQILRTNERNSKESFQAFGVTFPIETATRWGVFLILVIQLYFWVHLKEYRKRIYRESDIAWIGSYTSGDAKLLFCLTALLVPLGVVVFVSYRVGPLSQMTFRNIIICSTTVAASLFIALVTAKEYFKKDVVIA